ncbi:2-hydroxymuconic semialdehyde dehydrogenase [Beggiatoa leptomitoformis]|uniref:2-hydroxymuconic semialdehyde dehydrogenase n=1 Tax=Beggiatoa leptomitoformis TaxID=288004 RepID=A0A2N9YCB0_9GAMM|nr:2-hydroxymuconic semialdehyde dehydrogenase [Beggiatoa leptomitoformis]ALG66617.2 2-hydroxymuconic semialdehyde dehydrogenase [Beggiatoa leptomitoformis]AUI68072.2 2-hydroxymuconic semialdehyde dehydrogenase [Beggiatoa leptomitoformis]
MKEIKHFINGEFISSTNGKTFPDINPATGEVIAQVCEGGAKEVDLAVQAAKQAFKTWGKMPQAKRSALLLKLAEGIRARADDFIQAEIADTGKPISLASHIDIPRGSANFEQFAEHFKYVATECYEMEGALNYALRVPVGVIGVISPWNFPLLLMTWKVAPALAAGNCVVVKPSEETPATASLLGEVCNAVGIPAGVYNVVQGFGKDSAGEALSEHPDVRAITFTGETTTGKAIMRKAADSLKKLSFELGGKNPNLIFADADLEEALNTTMRSSFANQGQVCLCGSRVYAERSIFDKVVAGLVKRATETVKVGDPLNPQTTLGSLISQGHWERVMSYIDSAKADGATIHCGGKRPADLPAKFTKGAFLEPTVITGLDRHCKAQKEEIFGPVITVTPFDTEAEAIELANDTQYGLSATVWTSQLQRAHTVAAAMEAGILWVNTWFLRDLRTPFGGMKNSGIGREGGVHSLEFYSELKNVCIKL